MASEQFGNSPGCSAPFAGSLAGLLQNGTANPVCCTFNLIFGPVIASRQACSYFLVNVAQSSSPLGQPSDVSNDFGLQGGQSGGEWIDQITTHSAAEQSFFASTQSHAAPERNIVYSSCALMTKSRHGHVALDHAPTAADWAEEFEKLGTPFGALQELMELVDQLIEAAPEPEEESD